MCGIFGVICRPGAWSEGQVRRAVDTLSHRGPDLTQLKRWRVGSWEVWLGHTRLSIMDLHERSDQPMVRRRDELALVFNGEVYDHRFHREQVASDLDWPYRTSCDTETLLAGLDAHGPSFLEEISGMFAFGLLDQSNRTLLFGRDRLGKKPLYLYESEEMIVFASELKAIEALGVSLTINEEALAFYRWLNYIPGHQTIWRSCRRLTPGSWERVALRPDGLVRTERHLFWTPFGNRDPYEGSYEEAKHEFVSLLDGAVERRLEADVPLGIFLSGGVDSSLVACSAARVSKEPVSAFTVKPASAKLDESSVAAVTAAQLGLDHHILELPPSAYERQLGKVAYHYDEPFADSSQVPTMAISELASAHVRVILSGDGGDELFLGYPWHMYPERLWKRYRWLRAVPALGMFVLDAARARPGRAVLAPLLEAMGLNPATLDTKLSILEELVTREDVPHALYDTFQAVRPRAYLSQEDQRVVAHRCLLDWAKQWYPEYDWESATSLAELFAMLDLVTYLRDDLLVKVDRGSMAYGLEVRSPLLDERIVDFALSLPLEFKASGSVSKRILRDALAGQLGERVAHLKKRGFGIPMPAPEPPHHSALAAWNAEIEQRWRAQWVRD